MGPLVGRLVDPLVETTRGSRFAFACSEGRPFEGKGPDRNLPKGIPERGDMGVL